MRSRHRGGDTGRNGGIEGNRNALCGVSEFDYLLPTLNFKNRFQNRIIDPHVRYTTCTTHY